MPLHLALLSLSERKLREFAAGGVAWKQKRTHWQAGKLLLDISSSGDVCSSSKIAVTISSRCWKVIPISNSMRIRAVPGAGMC